jgi:hypothetical protein
MPEKERKNERLGAARHLFSSILARSLLLSARSETGETPQREPAFRRFYRREDTVDKQQVRRDDRRDLESDTLSCDKYQITLFKLTALQEKNLGGLEFFSVTCLSCLLRYRLGNITISSVAPEIDERAKLEYNLA